MEIIYDLLTANHLFLLLSATAQVLFAVSAIPYYLDFKKSRMKVWGLFELTWYVAEVLMIIGSIGLARYDLLPGLAINFIFLSLCLPVHFKNKKHRTEVESHLSDLLTQVQIYAAGQKSPDLSKKVTAPGSDTRH